MNKSKCPKCKCKRYRNVGSITYCGRRAVIAQVVECMRCGEVYRKKP